MTRGTFLSALPDGPPYSLRWKSPLICVQEIINSDVYVNECIDQTGIIPETNSIYCHNQWVLFQDIMDIDAYFRIYYGLSPNLLPGVRWVATEFTWPQSYWIKMTCQFIRQSSACFAMILGALWIAFLISKKNAKIMAKIQIL